MTLATAVVFGLAGLGLLGGGVWLAVLGGSWYYGIVGLGFLATALLLALRRRAALWVYALVLLGTLAWAIWRSASTGGSWHREGAFRCCSASGC